MANGFRLISELSAHSSVLETVLMKASTQFANYDLLTVPSAAGALSGIAAKAVATDSPTHVLNHVILPSDSMRPATDNLTTAVGERGQCTFCAGNGLIFETDMTGATDAPTFNGTAIKSVTSSTIIVFTGAGSTSDLRGGQIYIPEIDQQRTIVTDVVGGGDHTITVTPAFTVLPVAGQTLRAVPWSKGNVAIKLDATNPHQGVSTAVADKTGGKAKIERVDLKNLKLQVSFPQVY